MSATTFVAGLTPEWKTEAMRRASELDDGSVKPLSFDALRHYVEEKVA